MNLLTVDIGNTDIKFGIFKDGVLCEQWRATGTRTHPEKFSAMLRDSLARTDSRFEALVYTSVVPEVEHVFKKTIQYCFNLPPHRMFAVNPMHIKLPLDFSHYPLNQLGMDRLVNACSARLLYPRKDLIIVDFGTATTFDLVSADGIYWGGAITPGLQTFTDSLAFNTARLPHVMMHDKHFETLHMGTDTIRCMEAGLGFGYRGLVKELLQTASQTLRNRLPNLSSTTEEEFSDPGPTFTIATGGLATSVIQLCGLQQSFQVIDPVLTLKGLHQLYEFNRNIAAEVKTQRHPA